MKRATNDFIEENGATIKCLALAASDAAFSAYMAVQSDGLADPLWWIGIQNAMAATAQIYACTAPPPEVFEEAFGGENKQCQCAEVGGELFLDWLDADGNRTTLSNSELVEAKEIKNAVVTDGVASCNWITVEGEAKVSTYDLAGGSKSIWYIVPTLNTGCCSGSPNIPKRQPQPPPYIIPSTEEDCETTVQLLDSCVDKYGLSQNFYYVNRRSECVDDDLPFAFWYWESVKGPIVYSFYDRHSFEGFIAIPQYGPPHPDLPLPVSGGNNNTYLSAVTYTLDVGCTYNEETEDFDTKYTYDVEATNDGVLGLARRMDALAWMINNAQLIPYTACKNEKPVLEGDWVTLRFQSDEPSPNSNTPIRKLLRYRSKSDASLGSITDYWRGFTWTTGPVIVSHKDAWWGTPQVWAVSADEGKRVLRHVAGEAGIDPDQVGRWVISGSRDPRYGVSLPVRFADLDGGPWVTQREGPSGPAEINR